MTESCRHAALCQGSRSNEQGRYQPFDSSLRKHVPDGIQLPGVENTGGNGASCLLKVYDSSGDGCPRFRAFKWERQVGVVGGGSPCMLAEWLEHCRYLIPTFQPYGGWGWYLACLAPPSAVSLFANVLINVEASNRGLHWDSLGFNVTSKSTYPFSARVVFIALTLDILLYSLLAAYFDKVLACPLNAVLLVARHQFNGSMPTL